MSPVCHMHFCNLDDMSRLTAGFGLVMLILSGSYGCSSDGGPASAAGPSSLTSTSTGSERYVTVGFWNDLASARLASVDEPVSRSLRRHPVLSVARAIGRELGEPVCLRERELQLHAVDDADLQRRTESGRHPQDVDHNRLHSGFPSDALRPRARLHRVPGFLTLRKPVPSLLHSSG